MKEQPHSRWAGAALSAVALESPWSFGEHKLEVRQLVSSRDLCLGDHIQACLRLRVDRKRGADGNNARDIKPRKPKLVQR
jgi:hypothetical protein